MLQRVCFPRLHDTFVGSHGFKRFKLLNLEVRRSLHISEIHTPTGFHQVGGEKSKLHISPDFPCHYLQTQSWEDEALSKRTRSTDSHRMNESADLTSSLDYPSNLRIQRNRGQICAGELLSS